MGDPLGLLGSPPAWLCPFSCAADHHKFPIITWSEFKKIISQHLPEAAHEWPSHESVKEAFRVFDQEGFSYIHANQLKRFMQSALGDVEDDKRECAEEYPM